MDARLALLQLGTLLGLLSLALEFTAEPTTAEEVYTNTWAVHIEGGPQEADRISRKHGFINHGNVFGGYYHFRHHTVVKRSLSGHRGTHVRLQKEPQVRWAEQQVSRRRKKRDVYTEPSDPKFPQQWYLSNPSQADLNAKGAWSQGYTGRGVVVTILDDGIEKDHPDLATNYDPEASYDVNDGDSDPQPRYTQRNENRHGTRCAGEVAAAANNNVCGVGVAYNTKIGGVRMLDGEVTDMVEAHSLSLNSQHIHIYSASWGPEDDGKTVDGPAKLAKEAFLRGVTEGRGRLGSIFVWASGNGGREKDSCNCDGYTNSIYTLSISSTTQYGMVPWYSEACSSTLATTFSSGNPNEKQIVTTDLRQKCTDSHTGTSASAPLAAGIIALALEANMNLTWRDMQHLVVRTSHPAHLSTDDWSTNGVGRRVSHSYGYGLLDAGAMVALAQNWTSVGPQHQCVLTMLSEPRDISSRLLFSKTLDACWGKPEYVSSLEHVQARLTLSYNHRGNLAIHLISPLGTRSTLLAPRPKDYSSEGFNDWAFMTTHSWDEDPRGEWTLEIENVSEQGNDYGVLSQFTLILYGTGSSSINPLSPDFPRPSNNSCKTFDAQQICIECSPGFSLFLQGCVKLCPPGFTSGPQLLNLSLDNWVDLSSVQACLPCHPVCLTCSGPGPNDCLSCPPHSHLVLTACLHQNQVQRKSPTGQVLQGEGSGPGESPVGSEQGGEGEPPGPNLGLSSPLITLLAVLSCAFILAAFAGVFLLLQLRSGGAPWARRTKLHSVETGGGASGGIRVGIGFGLGLGWERQGRVSYKGIPTVWRDEDQVTLGGSESDSEELDCHSERTAFIRTQSSL
ncbi:furin (paired basic amino acid cleaving enzyme) b isoform X2 [Oncorhynchus tshawytscha]|uniref:furin (paired basic amino acid cleaving enzyme) b isoform X2 n=1 Tax=Oncorhynchus tshawytscha TaxID=74940 RepID=UPI000D0A757D|nr:furin (paired basic amino acid cleaving enzyme) b isoform X2 [Oncorhynchus tshawytscha]